MLLYYICCQGSDNYEEIDAFTALLMLFGGIPVCAGDPAWHLCKEPKWENNS
jgi:hypothetical protein